jgi:hypothetical protein
MPQSYRLYGESWRDKHPDWEMRLWTDQDADRLDCRETFSRARSYAERSDVLRYAVLKRHGGVYVDTDLECLRPIDDLLDGVAAFTAYLRPGRPKIGTAIMGCEPGHPAFEHAAARVAEWVGVTVSGQTGPWLMTEVVDAFPDVKVFDAELFYPYHWTELYRREDEFPEAYAVHHWSLRFLRKLEKRRAEVVARNARLRDQNRDLRKEVRKSRHELAEVEERLAAQKRAGKQLRVRLRAIEKSRWWRFRLFLKTHLGWPADPERSASSEERRSGGFERALPRPAEHDGRLAEDSQASAPSPS